MAQNTSYPEPDTAPDPMHPYQYPMPPSGHSHIPHEASMRRDSNGSGNFLHANGPIGGGQGQPSTPQQLAQRSLDAGHGTDQNDADSSLRKRSKVSRACDECRRKKIRCDAESETSGTICSACRRAGLTCDFSRAPQKRGPSKGYIKELAERVNFLEYKTGAAPPEIQYQPMVHEQTRGYTPPSDSGNRKRAYGSFDGPAPYDTTFNSLQAGPIEFNPRHQSTLPETPATTEQIIGGLSTSPQSQQRNMNATVVNEKWVKAYYELIHPLLPLLPRQIAGIQHNVENVPAGLCEAFFAALEAAITASTSGQIEPALTAAAKQLTIIPVDRQLTATLQSRLVYLQALILMIIATDNSGPSHVQDNRWFGLAIDVATIMRLHLPPPHDGREFEPYTRDLGRRCWLTLFILDRWNAAGTCGQLRIQENNAKLVDSDYELLGDATYNMFRLSRILGHLFDGAIHHLDELSIAPSKGGLLNMAISGEIETFRESVYQQYAKLPEIHLAYLYLQLLADRHMEGQTSNGNSIMSGVFHIVTLLKQKKGIYNSILIHHISALAAITLGEAADRQTNASANAALQDLRAGLDTALFRQGKGKTCWDAAISAFISKKLNDDQGGLEQLADAAVGKAKGNGPGDGPANGGPAEWSVASSKGYLNIFE